MPHTLLSVAGRSLRHGAAGAAKGQAAGNGMVLVVTMASPPLWADDPAPGASPLDDDYRSKIALTCEDSPFVVAGTMRWYSSVAAALAAASVSHAGWFGQITTRTLPDDARVIAEAAPRREDWPAQAQAVRVRLLQRKCVWDCDLMRQLLALDPSQTTDEGLVAAASYARPLQGRVVMVTGHRPQHLPAGSERWVRAELARVMGLLDPVHCLSGLAVGVDTFWAQEALRQGRGLVSYVPFPEQSRRWDRASQAEWRRLVDHSQEVVTVADSFQMWAFPERNRLMVTRAPIAVAVWDGKPTGGTADAVERIQGMGRTLVRINPLERRTTINRSPRPPEAVRV